MEQENKKGLENQEDLDTGKPNELDNDVEFKESTDLDEEQARKERLRARRLERRHRRNARIARCRTLKNFFIWILGVFFLPIAIAASMFVIPVGIINNSSGEPIVGGKVYTGSESDYAAHQDETDANYYKDLEKFSILELARYMAGDGMKYTTVSNFPVLIELIESLQDQTIINDKKFSDVVEIDMEKLKSVPINSLGDEISDCIEIVATISTFISEDTVGDFASLLFTDEKDVNKTAKQVNDDGEISDETKLAYYYKVSEVSGNTTYSADTASDSSLTKVVYKPAFEKKDDGSVVLVSDLRDASNRVKEGVKLYYPPIQSVKIGELKDIFSELFGQTEVEAIFKVAGAIKDGEESNEMLDILKSAYGKGDGEKLLISDLSGEMDKDSIKINQILEEIEDDSNSDYNKNQKMWRILRAATNSATNADVTAGSLARFDIDQVPLSAFLDLPTTENENKNKQLYDILMDLIEDETITTYDDIKVRHLSGLDTDNLHLKVVIPNSDNKLLKPLLDKDPTIKTLGSAIDSLEVSEIFNVECFTTTKANAVDELTVYYEYGHPYSATEIAQNSSLAGKVKAIVGYTTKSSVSGYTVDTTETAKKYYISKNAKVWLFMFYTSGTEFDANGSAKTYTEQSVTFGEMENTMSSASTAFTKATVKQLVQSGILTESSAGAYSTFYAYSFEYILTHATLH